MSRTLNELRKAGINARFPELTDRAPLIEAYAGALSKAKAKKDWVSTLNDSDVEFFVDTLISFDEAISVIIDEQFLFAYRVNKLWYRPNDKALEECSVIRVYPGKSNMTKVIRAMEEIARINDCVSIHVGTSIDPEDRVSKFYERSGFTQDSITFHKRMEG